MVPRAQPRRPVRAPARTQPQIIKKARARRRLMSLQKRELEGSVPKVFSVQKAQLFLFHVQEALMDRMNSMKNNLIVSLVVLDSTLIN